MNTLILPPRYTPDSVSLWQAAIRRGWRTERLLTYRTPEGLDGRGCVVYGEPLFVAAVAGALRLTPAEPALDWLARLPGRYRRREVRSGLWADVAALDGRTFVKPADDKCFPAQIYDSGSELLAAYDLPPDLPVLFSEPVRWEVEYRCFVRDRAVATLSPYFRRGELAQTETGEWPASEAEIHAAGGFAAEVLSEAAIDHPAAFVLDVGVIEGRGWAVVEANPACSSGIYGCETGAVLDTLLRACHSDPSNSAD